jgi:hypothetical protein
LGSYLGEMQYTVNGDPKVVRLWQMKPLGHSHGIEDQDEVQEAVWMSADQAVARLDYPLEKEMLTRAIQASRK